jgi:hypothetical protein
MNDMKTAFKILRHVAPLALYAILILVLDSGCQKSPPPTSLPVQSVPKSIQWEYRVVLGHLPPVIDAVAVAKTGLADAQEELAEAKASERVAAHAITHAMASAATNDAEVDLELKKTIIRIEREDQIQSALLQFITEQSTNSWELVSANISPEKPVKYILFFKRQKP